MAVSDQPDPVLPVQLTRLGGDIRFREAQIQVGGQHAVAVLGHDRAVPVRIELVDHRAVEAGQLADMHRGDLTQGLCGGRPLDRGHEAADRGIEVFQRAWLARHRGFQLDDDVIPDAVRHRRVVAGRADRKRAEEVRGTLLQRHQQRPAVGQRTAEHRLQGLAQRIAQYLDDVRSRDGAGFDGQCDVIEDQDQSVGLDRARGADRLTRAAGQIQGACAGIPRGHALTPARCQW
ncbi:hypothetical protein D3C71_1267770 [compost metagenome]